MLRNTLNHLCFNTAFVAALMACPLACAAAPSADAAGGNMIGTLLRTATPLSTRELAAVRGGFDISPRLTINFAFQQIESSGNKVIQSIEVPMTTLTLGSHNIVPVVTTSTDAGIPNVSGGGGTHTQTATNNTRTTIPTTPTTNNVPAIPNNIKLTSSANGGATVVQSQLGSGGITNLISNTANNAIISQMTTMNIAISGMTSWLSQQRSNYMSGGGAFGSLGLYR
jgi:hypothetical protein